MRRPSRTGLLWVLVTCVTSPITAQNLEAIGREKPLSVSGGISVNQIYYTSSGTTARRAPYSFVASGNANLALYGWHIPLSFTLSNHNSRFAQPFNQYAVHPKWKWITAHAGYTSMSLSPYTVNGHIFRGVAVDFEPEGKWHLSVLYGRFKKAVEGSTPLAGTPAFRRPGYALRARYGKGNDFAEVITFQARDVQHSIAPLDVSLGILPQQNLVVSAGAGKTLAPRLVLKGEVAMSALTRDTRAEQGVDHPLGKFLPFFPTTTATSYYTAVKGSFDYQRERWTIGAAYERIDPGYITLGAYYFNNDLRNITVHGTAKVLNEKLTLAFSSGVQRDNVDGSRMSTMRRMVGSCNIGYVPSQKLNLSASWSTFQTFTNIRSHFGTPDELIPGGRIDTLNFTQISRNGALTAMYAPGTNQDKKHTLTLNLSWQESADAQGESSANTTSAAFLNASAGYTITIVPVNMGFSLVFNTSVIHGDHANTRTMGPTASFTRSYFNRKLRTTLSASWNKTINNHLNTGAFINGRLNIAGSVSRNHQLTVGAVIVRRRASSYNTDSLELTATAGYQYSFTSASKQ